MTDIIVTATLIVAALSMSVHFGTWLTERPIRTTSSGEVFTEIQQGRDAVAARVMPVLASMAILLVVATAIVVRSDTTALSLIGAALVLFLGDTTVTVTKNVPLNKQIQNWAIDSPPSTWTQVRDSWEHYHTIRTALIVTGFACLAAGIVIADM